MQPTPTHWGLTVAEWLTIAAIVLGPGLAVATQLWFQSRKTKRDSKLWVFNTLMGLRPQILHVDFVKAFNMIDVVFYDNDDIRKGRKEFLNVVTAVQGRHFLPAEVEKGNDILAEMLAKMGKELGFEFDHTQIKNTGYLPQGFVDAQESLGEILQHGAAWLQGKQRVVMEISPAAPAAASGTPRH
jgi:uncharacterized protein DUF6680